MTSELKDQPPNPAETDVERQFREAFDKVNWKLVGRDTIYDKPWMRVHLDNFEKADGQVANEFVTVESANYVEILPYDPETGEVVLIVEYNRGLGEPLIKLPAGKIKKDQTPQDAIRAELKEETGHEGEIQEMATRMSIPIWYKAEATYALVRVNAGSYSRQKLDANEEIAVIRAPVREVLDMVLSNHPLMKDLDLNFALLYAVQSGLIDDKHLYPTKASEEMGDYSI